MIGPPATLTLSPTTDTNPVGTSHTVTATVTDSAGKPVSGVTVRFSVTGANTASGSATTNASGQAAFTYTGNTAGVDQIHAFADTNNNGTQNAGEPFGDAEKTWTAVNAPPVAADDSASTDEDNPVTIDVLANDSDPEGDTLTVDSVTQPTNGTAVVNPDDTVTYTPDPDFNGTDSFDYTISDGNGSTDTATVTVTVGGVNDPPVANDDAATTDEDTPVVIDVLANDTDADGNLDPSSVSVTGGPFNGSAAVNPNGTITYTPDPDFNGSDSFSYEVCDTAPACDTATVLITVGAVNDPPVAADDAASTDEDTPVIIDVLSNDSPGPADESSQSLTVDSVTQPANGTAVINPDNTVTYTPDPNFNGSDSFTYTACDDGTPS